MFLSAAITCIYCWLIQQEKYLTYDIKISCIVEANRVKIVSVFVTLSSSLEAIFLCFFKLYRFQTFVFYIDGCIGFLHCYAVAKLLIKLVLHRLWVISYWQVFSYWQFNHEENFLLLCSVSRFRLMVNKSIIILQRVLSFVYVFRSLSGKFKISMNASMKV